MRARLASHAASVAPFVLALSRVLAAGEASRDTIPFSVPPRVVAPVQQWTFSRDAAGWVAEHDCRLMAADGLLKVVADGDDPHFHHSLDCPGGYMRLSIKARGCAGSENGEVFWATDRHSRNFKNSVPLALKCDGQWHEYQVWFEAMGQLKDLRIDPGDAPGELEIASIRLDRGERYPLEVVRLGASAGEASADRARVTIKNCSPRRVEFTALGVGRALEAGATVTIEKAPAAKQPLVSETMEIVCPGFPPVRWPVSALNMAAQTDWIVRSLPPARPGAGSGYICRMARDGSLVRIECNGVLVAFLGPLVHYEGRIPALKLVEEGTTIRFRGDGISVSLLLDGGEIAVAIDSQQECEGPVVRVLGGLEQGLFAGLEYLGKGERSSSTLDIETPEHLRFAPDPMKVTMPLMVQITDRASVAMTWSDMALQPVYATPNFFDGTNDHRMALRGRRIAAAVRVDRSPLEEEILWAVRKHGLPPLPQPPRTWLQQRALCLDGLNGRLRSSAGWGRWTNEHRKHRPYVDMASTIWRLTGEVPSLPRLVQGGAHVANDSVWFVTGRVQQWLDAKKEETRELLALQQADGSFRYEGEYLHGHYEDTASGFCANHATTLLEWARLTGDQAALQAGLRTLEYMRRFRVPRGAQTWELSLHTPDQLGSAYLVWAYVRGYELSGQTEYLTEARKWALSGVPFVYLWSCRPVMLYGNTPVYGASNWWARPSWMGLPVPWVNIVYAYALAMLAPHDRTLDWNHLARGILIAGEQMQYPDGPNKGLLPDSFTLATQNRRAANINPCTLVSLRLALDGKLDSLSVACDGRRRVVAPFPVVIRDGTAHVQGIPGTQYQLLVDGLRIVTVNSTGEDQIALDQEGSVSGGTLSVLLR